MMLQSKKIAIGVTGGIAAYKVCEVIRRLRKLGAEVRVAMTRSAHEFVTELTFATLSERPVMTSLFANTEKTGIAHIDLARWCDLFIVCPATANIIAKVANGIAEDPVSTTVLATEAKVTFCPAMNHVMWQKSVVQENLNKLQDLGYQVVSPEWGPLATEAEGEGMGRLASPERIVQSVRQSLLGSTRLKGKKVLVTAGPTVEAIDPVRFISNRSSGKMGFALAETALLKGAEVVLVTGSKPRELLDGIKIVEVVNTEEMQRAVQDEYRDADLLLMAAAVADYRPKNTLKQKMKKENAAITLELQPTSDILAGLGARKTKCLHIGFALETENGLANATRKLHAKNLDMVVLNNPLEPGAGFLVDTNVVTIITADGAVEKLPTLPKTSVAEVILEKAANLFENRSPKAAAI